jgi:hypothetical protein
MASSPRRSIRLSPKNNGAQNAATTAHAHQREVMARIIQRQQAICAGSIVLLCLLWSGTAWTQTPDYVISNGRWRVGLSTEWGGAITLLQSVDGDNWVDNGLPDPGRSIQLSMYQSAEPHTNAWPCAGGTWGYNPVQAGTMSVGTCQPMYSTAAVLSSSNAEVTTRTYWPWNWNARLGKSNLVIDQKVSFQSGYLNVVRIDYTVYNFEAFTVSGAQEAPVAVFTNALPFRSAYVGDRPWTNAPLTVASDGRAAAAEEWVAATTVEPNDPTAAGVALYAPDMPAGSAMHTCCSSTLQAFRDLTIAPGATASFTAYLVLGNIGAIRHAIYRLHLGENGSGPRFPVDRREPFE